MNSDTNVVEQIIGATFSPIVETELAGRKMLSKPLVLVIDEESLFLDFSVRILRSYSVAALGVSTAAAGRRLLVLLEPDLVIIDPSIEDGFALLEEVRSRQPRSEVIVVTSSDDIAQRARSMGAQNVVIKSDGFEDLIDGVVLLLGNRVTGFRPGTGMRILLVDDDDQALDVLSAFLSQRDYIVVTARAGTEALEIIQNDSSIGLVVLNLIALEMGGLETLKRIRSQKPRMGVIMLSSFPDREIARRVFQLGAFDYLLKPLDLKLLEFSIVACLAHVEYRRRSWWRS